MTTPASKDSITKNRFYTFAHHVFDFAIQFHLRPFHLEPAYIYIPTHT